MMQPVRQFTIDEVCALPLPADAYWYLASPYSKYPAGLDAAFRDIARVAAEFARRGVPVYSPIAHTHPIAIEGGIDPLNHGIWLPFDAPMMRAAHGLIVAMMPSWEQSFGIAEEVKDFAAMGKPFHHMVVSDAGL